MEPAHAVQRLAGDALIVLLRLAAALGHIRDGDARSALEALNRQVQAAPESVESPYRHEALYWRARLGEAQIERDARRSAARDYVQLLSVLPEGRRRREVRVRLAALAEPGRVLGPADAREASRRNLERVGLALHAYAVDHAGALPESLFDLVGEYVTDPRVLVRPGPRGAGGVYEYTPGLRADALRPRGARPVGMQGEAARAAGWDVPIVVREPDVAYEPVIRGETALAVGPRLVLGLDGAVRSVQEKGAGGGEQ